VRSNFFYGAPEQSREKSSVGSRGPNDRLTSTPGRPAVEFLCRNSRHHHPRHFRIKPADAVGANDKVGRVENMALNEIQHGTVDKSKYEIRDDLSLFVHYSLWGRGPGTEDQIVTQMTMKA
jgi:hypothetical protein